MAHSTRARLESALRDLRSKHEVIELATFERWLRRNEPDTRFHFALMSGPYLELLFAGTKSIESRFSKNRTAPFGILRPDDVVIFQTVGGNIDGFGLVKSCSFFNLTNLLTARCLMEKYEDGLRLEPDFIERKSDASYATLIWFKKLVVTKGPQVAKGDRRGWVPLTLEHSAPRLL